MGLDEDYKTLENTIIVSPFRMVGGSASSKFQPT